MKNELLELMLAKRGRITMITCLTNLNARLRENSRSRSRCSRDAASRGRYSPSRCVGRSGGAIQQPVWSARVELERPVANDFAATISARSARMAASRRQRQKPTRIRPVLCDLNPLTIPETLIEIPLRISHKRALILNELLLQNI